MTGYGWSERSDDETRIRVEVRSVNQRFLDVQLKAPRLLLQVEDRIRTAIESALSRGRLTVFVEWKSAAAAAPTVNKTAAHELIRQLRSIGEDLSVPGEINLSLLAGFSQIFEQGGETPEADAVWAAFEPALNEALARLVAMREAEGSKLGDELVGRLDAIESITGSIEAVAPEASTAMKERLRTRLASLMDGPVPVDETRLAQEFALAAERVDFTEEVVRLRAHVAACRECLDESEPVGKRLNFLVQEMHREANTIGSKGGDLGITGSVVSIKEEIEKLREQVQNVE